jgi:hypothetical protein
VTEDTRNAVLQLLGAAMSDISEECYCAGWSGGTQYAVPELCRRAIATGETQHWGHGEVTLVKARGLVALAELVGSWADLDQIGAGYVPFQPFPLPPEYLEGLDQERRGSRASLKSNPN